MSLSDDIAAITGTTQQYRWNFGAPLGTPIFVTYSSPTAPAAYDTGPGFAALGALQRTYARMALDTWAAGSGIRFLEVPEATGGQIRFSFTDFSAYPGYAGFAYYPNSGSVTYNGVETQTWPSLSITGDIFLNPALFLAYPTFLAPGQDGFPLLLHEIGHALGFKHPFEGDPVIEPAHDNDAYTALSYNGRSTTTALGSIDLAAVQLYYGSRPFDFSWEAGSRSLTVTGTGGDDVIGRERVEGTGIVMRDLPVHIAQPGRDEAFKIGHRLAHGLGNWPRRQVELKVHQARPAPDMPEHGRCIAGSSPEPRARSSCPRARPVSRSSPGVAGSRCRAVPSKRVCR